MTVHDVPRSVRIPAEVDQRLARLAAQTGRSKSFHLRELVTHGLNELEYAYGVAARAAAIRAGVRQTRPLGDLMAEIGITPGDLASAAGDPAPDERRPNDTA